MITYHPSCTPSSQARPWHRLEGPLNGSPTTSSTLLCGLYEALAWTHQAIYEATVQWALELGTSDVPPYEILHRCRDHKIPLQETRDTWWRRNPQKWNHAASMHHVTDVRAKCVSRVHWICLGDPAKLPSIWKFPQDDIVKQIHQGILCKIYLHVKRGFLDREKKFLLQLD